MSCVPVGSPNAMTMGSVLLAFAMAIAAGVPCVTTVFTRSAISSFAKPSSLSRAFAAERFSMAILRPST